MTINLDGRALFAPGDRVRLIDARDITGLVTGTSIYGPSGHVKYDLCWIHNGERKEVCVQESEIEAVQ